VPSKWLAPQKPKELLDGFCPEPSKEEQIAVNSHGLMLFLRLADIEWVEVVGQGVALHVGPITHLLSDTLTAVAAKLPAEHFLRVNRTTLVNIAQIKELQPAIQGGYDVVLRDGTRVNRDTAGEARRVLSPEPKHGAERNRVPRKPKLSRWDW
jgi:DNA-binding LytR/AlgR family response regulator